MSHEQPSNRLYIPRTSMKLNAKEACYLYMAADDSKTISEDGTATLHIDQICDILRQDWDRCYDKLYNARAIKALDQRSSDKREHTASIDTIALIELGTSPAGTNEIARLLVALFKDAETAIATLSRRTRLEQEAPTTPQSINCNESLLIGYLGPLWRDRLNNANLPFQIDEDDPTPPEKKQVYFTPITPYSRYAEGALISAKLGGRYGNDAGAMPGRGR